MILSVAAPVNTLAKCAHKHTQWVVLVKTTCTKDGKTVCVCKDCNKTLKVVKTRHRGHNFDVYHKSPTCTRGGESGKQCWNCDKKVVTSYQSALGHKFESKTSNATCTNPKIVVNTCKRCHYSFASTKGKALGHKWSEWALDSASLLKGHKPRLKRTCSRCGKKDYHYK